MISNYQWFCFLLLIVNSVWSLNQSEYGLYWMALDDPYGRIFFQSATMNRSLYKRLFSLQMTQTHKYGLPKCSEQQNECRKIGIVGAGEFSFDQHAKKDYHPI